MSPPASSYTHERAASIGPCRVVIRDTDKSAWLHFCKMDNVEVRREATEAVAREILQNVKRDMRRVQTDMKVTLRGDIMESINPNVLEMLFGDGSVPTTFEAAAVTQTKEIVHLAEEKAIPLLRPHIIASTLPPPTNTVIALSGIGSTLTQVAHYVWVTASYDESDDHHSTPDASTPASVTVTAAQENILVTWDAPVTGNPHHYTVWESQAAGVATALKVGTTNSLSYLITADATGTAYNTTDTNPFIVKDYTEVTTYVANTDYVFNTTLGTVRRMNTGAIGNGEPVIVTYHFNAAKYSQTEIGPGRMQVRTAALRLYQIAGVENEAGDAIVETGLIIDLHKVDLLGGSFDWPFTEDEFFAGVSIELECMIAPQTNTFGTVEGHDEVMEDWVRVAEALG